MQKISKRESRDQIFPLSVLLLSPPSFSCSSFCTFSKVLPGSQTSSSEQAPNSPTTHHEADDGDDDDDNDDDDGEEDDDEDDNDVGSL